VRHFWGEQWDDLEPEAIDYLSAPNEMRELLTNELILSGEMDRMAQRLSWRVAARCAKADRTVDPQLIADEERRFFERSGLNGDELAGWLQGLGRDLEWWRDAIVMEAIHRRDCTTLLSHQARAREIAALRLPLTRFEVEMIELDSLDASREALLCAREDGMSMEDVAAQGRYPYRHPEVFLEEIPEDLQQKFLSVHPGEILDPIAHGEVGKVGVSISSVHDMEILFKEIPLETVSTSMTMNAPAGILLAMYIATLSGSGTASASAFFLRIATFVSRSGDWMSAMRPHSKRERNRSSRDGISCGGQSLLMTICFCASYRALNVWKNSFCVPSLPARNWMSSTRSTSTDR